MKRYLFVIVLTATFAAAAIAQKAADPKANSNEAREKMRADALLVLRETISEINNLRTRENRLSFTADAAALFWQYDEQGARNMFADAAGELIHVLRELDQDLNALEAISRGEQAGFDFFEPSDKQKITAKLNRTMTVRQQLAMSIADHDPDLALQFYYDSGAAVTSKDMEQQSVWRDNQFEQTLLSRVAETNAKRAGELAARSMAKKLLPAHFEVVKKIYQKDTDEGIKIGAVLLSKLKDSKDLPAYSVVDLFRFAQATLKTTDKKPLYSQAELRELAEAMAGFAMDDTEGFSAYIYVTAIEAMLPGRAAQIRAKHKLETPKKTASDAITATGAEGIPAENMNTAGKPDEKAVSAADAIKMFENFGELPKEERAKVIEKAREIIAKARTRREKIFGLGALAVQVAKAGDRELADQIMRDAEALAPSAPLTMADYLLTFVVVSAYAEANPAKAFEMLDGMAYKANHLLDSFASVAEFMDMREDMIINGELMTGAFGGGMMRGITGGLTAAKAPMMNLAEADLRRMVAVANSIKRPEVRIPLKLLVLSTILETPDDRSKAASPRIPN